MNEVTEVLLDCIRAEAILQNIDKLSIEEVQEGVEAMETDMKEGTELGDLPPSFIKLYQALKKRVNEYIPRKDDNPLSDSTSG